jgi:hypothetical protein
MEVYIKPSSTSRRGCGFHSLSSIVAKLQSPRSLSLATRLKALLGFEGEDLDLHLHQGDLISPLVLLRGL